MLSVVFDAGLLAQDKRKPRPAARVGRPENALAQSISATANADNLVPQDHANAAVKPKKRLCALAKQRNRGQPAKHGRGHSGKHS